MGNSPEKSSLNVQMLFTLLALFLVFVVLDVVSTIWLIGRSPGGIENEINPVGILLYNVLGSSGMVFPKFGLFVLFASMAMYFSSKHSDKRWFIEVTETLVLIQMAISLVVSFNNFVAILASFYVGGIWPLVNISPQQTVVGIYIADLALGGIFANGVMYMWGIRSRQTHLKIFVSLMVFITPVLLFAAGFRSDLWLFGLYVSSASVAVGLFFYATERSNMLDSTGMLQ